MSGPGASQRERSVILIACIISSKRIEFDTFSIEMERVSIRGWICGSCVGMIVGGILSLAITTGLVFLSFYIGWSVQYKTFVASGNGLASGYASLFAVPAVSDAWSVFSCFLYGALILLAASVPLGVLLFCIGACCGLPILFCCCGNPSDEGEGSHYHTTAPRNYGSLARSHMESHFPKFTVVSQ
jgi:hypothetical protein